MQTDTSITLPDLATLIPNWNEIDELIVDAFAGGGGASSGIERALGISPHVAINHDPEALALHAANHPDTVHLPHNIWKVDPFALTKGKPVGLLWASPDCKHFSRAAGGKPRSKNIRDLAWVIVRWARQVRPRVILMENVEEFQEWGPLTEENMPCPERKGQTFAMWKADLKRLGYKIEHKEMRACDYGAPTIRKRFFLCARRDGQPIVWPEPTHGDPASPEVQAGILKPWRTAAEIIDWTLPCHSIFLSKEEGREVGVNRPLAEKTMARIAKGVKRYVLDNARPFVVPVTHTGGDRVHDSAEPLRTITTAQRGELSLVVPHVTKFRSGSVGHSMEEPLHTVTANGESRERPGGAAPIGVVAPYLVPRYGERPGQEPRTVDVDRPMPVVVPTANGGSLAAVALTKFSENSIGTDLDQPLHTVMAGAPRHGIVSAFMAQHNEGMVGHAMDEAVSTITAKGSHQQLVKVDFLSQQYSSNQGNGGDLNDPMGTVTAGGMHTAHVSAFMLKYFGTDQDPRLEEPCHTVTTKHRFGLVTVNIQGEPYVIADIGMRMLSPRELYRAQGFDDNYIIDRGLIIREDGTREWIKLTKTAQVRMCGNSVCPPLAEALAKANYRPLEKGKTRRRVAAELPLFAEVAA